MIENNEVFSSLEKSKKVVGDILTGFFVTGITMFAVVGFFGALVFFATTYGEEAETLIDFSLLTFRFWMIGLAIFISLLIIIYSYSYLFEWSYNKNKKIREERAKEFFNQIKKVMDDKEHGRRRNSKTAKSSR